MFKSEKKHIYFWERITFRILVGFFLPLAVSGFVLFSISNSFHEMQEQREHVQSQWSGARVNETKAVLELTRTKVSLESMWTTGKDPTQVGKHLQAFERYVRQVGSIAGEENNNEGAKIINYVLGGLKQSILVGEQLTDSVRRGDRATWERTKPQFESNLTELEKSIDRLIAVHELAETRDVEAIGAREHQFTENLYYLMAFTAIFGFVLSLFVTYSVSGPVKQLVRCLQDIATGEGDLTKRIDSRFTTGEMKEMAAWMNLFLDKTQSIIATIANASVVIRRTTEQVTGFTSTSTVLAVSINKNMMTQSMNLDECSQSLGKIDDLLQASGDSSKQAASLSKIAMDRALQGGASVNETIEAMEKIEESADKVEVLVSSINEIAAQTNLLAINAAIEASKAGEHGKGFAVVAEEVRKLAERTRKLTGQVTSLITESNSRVKTGVSLAKNAGVALDGIIQDVEAVSSLIQRIAASSSKQTESSTQLVTGMRLVTDGIHENLQQMTQVTQAVEHTSNELQRLDALVGELNQIVGQFRVTEDTGGVNTAPPSTATFYDSDGSHNVIKPLPKIPPPVLTTETTGEPGASEEPAA